MKSTATAAWSVTGLAAATVVAVTIGMGLQDGGTAAASLSPSAPLGAAATARHDDDRQLASPLARSTTAGAVERRGDVPGPCDEAEHVGDPRCTGVVASAPAREAGEDISGPCDEAEHAADPRCTGAAAAGARGGRDGRAEDRRGDDGRETADDRRDDNRRGNDDSDGRGDGGESSDDSSGHGGSGHGGSGDDSSGHGGSGH